MCVCVCEGGWCGWVGGYGVRVAVMAFLLVLPVLPFPLHPSSPHPPPFPSPPPPPNCRVELQLLHVLLRGGEGTQLHQVTGTRLREIQHATAQPSVPPGQQVQLQQLHASGITTPLQLHQNVTRFRLASFPGRFGREKRPGNLRQFKLFTSAAGELEVPIRFQLAVT